MSQESKPPSARAILEQLAETWRKRSADCKSESHRGCWGEAWWEAARELDHARQAMAEPAAPPAPSREWLLKFLTCLYDNDCLDPEVTPYAGVIDRYLQMQGRAPEPPAPAVNWGDGMTADRKPIVPKVYPNTPGTCESPFHCPHHKGQLHGQDDVCVNFEPVSAPAPSATNVLIECERIANIMAWAPIDVGHVYELPLSNGERVNFKIVRIIEQEASAPSSGGISSKSFPTIHVGAVISAVPLEDAEALERERDHLQRNFEIVTRALAASHIEQAAIEQELAAARHKRDTLVVGLRLRLKLFSDELSDRHKYSGDERHLFDRIEADILALLPPVTNGSEK